ncbi:unnamed protein product [Cylicocyclus nassatus]|uniref:Uncharacterized protein n=1 Tax=Cylicocyclus nassatus TaxID=53992 RepID=A0AA36GQS0_CYLNA|nr:unnamed protein product [Cylicocyclus nassatus]
MDIMANSLYPDSEGFVFKMFGTNLAEQSQSGRSSSRRSIFYESQTLSYQEWDFAFMVSDSLVVTSRINSYFTGTSYVLADEPLVLLTGIRVEIHTKPGDAAEFCQADRVKERRCYTIRFLDLLRRGLGQFVSSIALHTTSFCRISCCMLFEHRSNSSACLISSTINDISSLNDS